MKKVLIGIAIAVVGACCVAGGYYYEMAGSNGQQSSVSTSNIGNSTKESNLGSNKEQNNNSLLAKGNNAPSNNSNTKEVSSNNNNIGTNEEGKSNNVISGSEEGSNNESGVNNKESTSKNVSENNTINNNNSNENNSGAKSNGKIEIIPPNVNAEFPLSTVIVKNDTGKPISDSDLNYIMRQWILKWQYGYYTFCMADGALWASQWLDAIPNSELINAFIEVNGTKALSENITANELKKASIAFTIKVNEGPVPFSAAQATKYIKQMLEQQASSSGETNPKDIPVITKVVLHKGKDGGGCYYVYTKWMQERGYKNPYWFVCANTGYASGV